MVRQRVVRDPSGREVAWDVVGHDKPQPAFVVVVPFDTRTVRRVPAALCPPMMPPSPHLLTRPLPAFEKAAPHDRGARVRPRAQQLRTSPLQCCALPTPLAFLNALSPSSTDWST